MSENANLKIKFKKLDERALPPTYQTAGASGFDFCALENIVLKAGDVTLVRTGLSVEIPEGFELQIRARSGLSAKHGIFLVNGVGTIDSDYRGEIKIIMSTCISTCVELNAGDRIAQGVLMKVARATLVEASVLSESLRGEGGFGSTGLTAKSKSETPYI